MKMKYKWSHLWEKLRFLIYEFKWVENNMKNNIILTAISTDKDCNTYEVQFDFCKDVIYNDEDEVKNNIARFTSNFRIMNVQMKISFFSIE